MTPLTLYADRFWTSPYVFSVFVALREKGLPFAIETVALERREQRSTSFRSVSLTSRVPVLVLDGFALSESSAIVEYLDEVFPSTPVLPKETQARARARQVMAWIRSDLLPIREERPTSTIFYAPTSTPMSPAAEQAAEKLLYVASTLIPADGGDLFGTWCIADADLALMLNRLVANGHDVPEPLRTYVARQWSRPTVREFVLRERPPYVPY